MAVSTTFKQMCPSCEAMVTIKEEKIGKKVECNQCKDKFIAVKPKSVGKGGSSDDDEDDIEDLDDEEAPVQVKAGKGKPGANGKSNGKARHVDDDDDDEDDDDKPQAKSKKKAGGSNKLTLGLILAGVAVVVLAVASYFVIFNTPSKGGTSGSGHNATTQPATNETKKDPGDNTMRPIDTQPIGSSDADLVKLTNLLPNDSEHVFHVFFKDLLSTTSPLRDAAFQSPGSLRDTDLRDKLGFSLLGIDDLIRAERYSGQGWVFTVIHFKEFLNEASVKSALKLSPANSMVNGQSYYRLTEPNPWFDTLAHYSFGIPNNAMMLARRSTGPTFVRFHNSQTLIVGDEAPVIAFLNAKGQFPLLSAKAGAAPANPAPAPGVPNPDAPKIEAPPPNKAPGEGGKAGMKKPGMKKAPKSIGGGASAVEFDYTLASQISPHLPRAENDDNAFQIELAQTLQNLPDVNPNFKAGPAQTPEPGPNPAVPATPGAAINPAPAAAARDETYLTIKPALKAILDRMEARAPGSLDKVFFSSATDMDASCTTTNLPEFKDRVARRPRQIWDVTLMLPESKPRINFLGTALVQKELMKFLFRNEIGCAQEIDAKEFQKELTENTAYNIKNFVSKMVNHEIQLPSVEEVKPPPPPPPPPPGGKLPKTPEKKREEPIRSKIKVTQESTNVEFAMDLVLDNPVMAYIIGIANLSAGFLRSEMETLASGSNRHFLARAGKTLGEKGLTARDIGPGNYPPGAFPRTNIPPGVQREPKNRISWMAGLLPYMGQQNLFDRIRFDQSWRDPGNWLPGRTIVPQFLNPAYPEYTRQVSVADLAIDFGATHYVGIAGVGNDAASYKRGNQATQHKEGIFSYEGSAKLEDVSKGRGLSNTIVMIELPYDGITGVSPWMAGGGATVRGVPEKNSIAPFVHSVDRGGKTTKGTYAMMADGSVRFIDQNVSDDVFKAMCTVRGPVSENFDLNKDPNTPLVPVPKGNELKGSTKPADTTDQYVRPRLVPIAKDKGPTEAKSDLDGVWVVKSLENEGVAAKVEQTSNMRIEVRGNKLIKRGAGAGALDEGVPFYIDPKKSPKQIDFIDPHGTESAQGIYDLKQGEFWLCIRPEKNPGGRPTAFSTQPKSGMMLFVFRRMKSDEQLASSKLAVPGKFAIEAPAGFEWLKLQDINDGKTKGSLYLGASTTGVNQNITLAFIEGLPTEEDAKREFIKGFLSSMDLGLKKSGANIVGATKPDLKSPIPAQVEFSNTITAMDGSPKVTVGVILFRRSVYSISVTTSSDNESRDLLKSVVASLKE